MTMMCSSVLRGMRAFHHHIHHPPSPIVQHTPISGVTLSKRFLKVPRDVLLYTNKENAQRSRLMAVCGVGQLIAVSCMCVTAYDTFPAFFGWIPTDKVSHTPIEKDRLPLASESFRWKYTIFCFLASSCVAAVLLRYSLRTVHSVKLLKQTSSVELQTVKVFGGFRNLVAPVAGVSAKHMRADTPGTHMQMKVKGKLFRFMLDKSEGVFHNAALFDRTVGQTRDLT